MAVLVLPGQNIIGLRRATLTIIGLRYRTMSRILHYFNLHHTTESGPMDDGVTLIRCEWCGISGTNTPMEIIEARINTVIEKSGGYTPSYKGPRPTEAPPKPSDAAQASPKRLRRCPVWDRA
jgi:hypothetical protein